METVSVVCVLPSVMSTLLLFSYIGPLKSVAAEEMKLRLMPSGQLSTFSISITDVAMAVEGAANARGQLRYLVLVE